MPSSVLRSDSDATGVGVTGSAEELFELAGSVAGSLGSPATEAVFVTDGYASAVTPTTSEMTGAA